MSPRHGWRGKENIPSCSWQLTRNLPDVLTCCVFTASQNVGGAARGKAQNKRPACALAAIFAAQPRAPEELRHRRERSRLNFVRRRDLNGVEKIIAVSPRRAKQRKILTAVDFGFQD